jgi:hypothetical protein
MEVNKSIDIRLPNGTIATIDMSRQMVEKIMSTFTLEDEDMITENHVKYFLASSMRNALETVNVQ